MVLSTPCEDIDSIEKSLPFPLRPGELERDALSLVHSANKIPATVHFAVAAPKDIFPPLRKGVLEQCFGSSRFDIPGKENLEVCTET